MTHNGLFGKKLNIPIQSLVFLLLLQTLLARCFRWFCHSQAPIEGKSRKQLERPLVLSFG